MFALTSYERLRRYCAGTSSDPLTDNEKNRRELTQWIGTVSNQIERYCGREFHIEARTEYFDLTYNKKSFQVKAPPITTLTSLYLDSTGQWDGSESQDSDAFIGIDSRSANLYSIQDYEAYKAVRVIYTGGLALSATQSVYGITGSSGTWTTGKFVIGDTSRAMGIVRAVSAASMTIEVLNGLFQLDEGVTEQDTEAAVGNSDGTATLDSATSLSLAEAYPELVNAAEMQIRYNWKHKHDFENTATDERGQTSRDRTQGRMLNLQPEAVALIEPYRNIDLW